MLLAPVSDITLLHHRPSHVTHNPIQKTIQPDTYDTSNHSKISTD